MLAVAEPTDPSAAYAAFAAELRFEDLPVELVPTLKRIVYDTLGTTLAGTTLGSGCPELLDLVRRAGGAPESTLLGSSSRVPASMAALANGATAHALNYDDVFPGGGHLGVVTLPAALAVAERRGGVSGRGLLAALAAGIEIMARLLLAVRNRGRRSQRRQSLSRPRCWVYSPRRSRLAHVLNWTPAAPGAPSGWR